MKQENGEYFTENLTDVYMLTCMIELHNWCKQSNPGINAFQNKVIDITCHIKFADDAHPFLLLQEHPDWMYAQASLAKNWVSIDDVVKEHLADYIKHQLWSNLFKDGLPGFTHKEHGK